MIICQAPLTFNSFSKYFFIFLQISWLYYSMVYISYFPFHSLFSFFWCFFNIYSIHWTTSSALLPSLYTSPSSISHDPLLCCRIFSFNLFLYTFVILCLIWYALSFSVCHIYILILPCQSLSTHTHLFSTTYLSCNLHLQCIWTIC